MKNFKLIAFILAISSLLFFSCEKELIRVEQDENKVFSKTLELSDNLGNQAIVSIASAQYSKVLEISKDDLEFNIYTDLNVNLVNYDEPNLIEGKEFDRTKEEGFNQTVFIIVEKYIINENVKGFNVILKNNFIETREVQFFEYGANGVRGTHVIMSSEEQPSCWLEIDVGKLKTTSSWFYTEMCDGRLDDPDDFHVCYESTEYYKYRLRLDVRGSGCSWIGFSFVWLT